MMDGWYVRLISHVDKSPRRSPRRDWRLFMAFAPMDISDVFAVVAIAKIFSNDDFPSG